jgi:hypothetical protein
LTPKIDECQQVFNAMQIRRSLYGLQKMSSDVREVKNVLAALAPKIDVWWSVSVSGIETHSWRVLTFVQYVSQGFDVRGTDAQTQAGQGWMAATCMIVLTVCVQQDRIVQIRSSIDVRVVVKLR